MLPAVVFVFSVQNKSLTAKGIPGSNWSKFGLLSNCFALSKAWSNVVVTNAFNFFALSIFFTYALVNSVDETFYVFKFSIISFRLWFVISAITPPP